MNVLMLNYPLGMQMLRTTIAIVTILAIIACYKVESPEAMLSQTGLQEYKLKSGDSYLGKVHRGYKVFVSSEATNVWLRFGSRLAASQVSTELELGRAWEFILGGRRRSPTGSPFDRLLSKVLGQPISILVILKHDKKIASRLDVISNYSSLTPSDVEPKVRVLERELGIPVTTLYSSDFKLADKVLKDGALLESFKNYRSFYIRVDKNSTSFFFAGNENELSQMLSEHDYSYAKMLNAIFDDLADISDKLD